MLRLALEKDPALEGAHLGPRGHLPRQSRRPAGEDGRALHLSAADLARAGHPPQPRARHGAADRVSDRGRCDASNWKGRGAEALRLFLFPACEKDDGTLSEALRYKN